MSTDLDVVKDSIVDLKSEAYKLNLTVDKLKTEALTALLGPCKYRTTKCDNVNCTPFCNLLQKGVSFVDCKDCSKREI